MNRFLILIFMLTSCGEMYEEEEKKEQETSEVSRNSAQSSVDEATCDDNYPSARCDRQEIMYSEEYNQEIISWMDMINHSSEDYPQIKDNDPVPLCTFDNQGETYRHLGYSTETATCYLVCTSIGWYQLIMEHRNDSGKANYDNGKEI